MAQIRNYRELREFSTSAENTRDEILRLRNQIVGRPGFGVRGAPMDLTTQTEEQLRALNAQLVTLMTRKDRIERKITEFRNNARLIAQAVIDARTARGQNPQTIIFDIVGMINESINALNAIDEALRGEMNRRAEIARLAAHAARAAAEAQAAAEAEERRRQEEARRREAAARRAARRQERIEAGLAAFDVEIAADEEARRLINQEAIAAEFAGRNAFEFGPARQFRDRSGPNIPIPTTIWRGFTQADINNLNSVFDTEHTKYVKNPDGTFKLNEEGKRIPHNSSRTYRELYAACPICLSYVDRGEGCIYIQGHNCKREAERRGDGLYHRELYNKYRNASGTIVFCSICSRICQNAPEAHLELVKHDAPKARLTGQYGNPFVRGEAGCRALGGGGFREKTVRFNTIRNTAFELGDQVGEITRYDAFRQIVEAAWDSPLAPTVMRNGRFNIPNTAFPAIIPPEPTVKRVIPRNGFETPTILMEGTNTVIYVDEPPLIQFHHLDRNGNMHHHEDKIPGPSGLLQWIGNDAEHPHRCFSDTCGGYLYPQEIEYALNTIAAMKNNDGEPYYTMTKKDRDTLKLYTRNFYEDLQLSAKPVSENNMPSLSEFDDMFHPAEDATCSTGGGAGGNNAESPDGGGAGGANYPPGWPGRGGRRKNTKRRFSNRKRRSTRKR